MGGTVGECFIILALTVLRRGRVLNFLEEVLSWRGEIIYIYKIYLIICYLLQNLVPEVEKANSLLCWEGRQNKVLHILLFWRIILYLGNEKIYNGIS